LSTSRYRHLRDRLLLDLFTLEQTGYTAEQKHLLSQQKGFYYRADSLFLEEGAKMLQGSVVVTEGRIVNVDFDIKHPIYGRFEYIVDISIEILNETVVVKWFNNGKRPLPCVPLFSGDEIEGLVVQKGNRYWRVVYSECFEMIMKGRGVESRSRQYSWPEWTHDRGNPEGYWDGSPIQDDYEDGDMDMNDPTFWSNIE
jgi:hypothetical protein